MKRFLLQVWKHLPYWLQVVLSRIIRPLFQVFSAAVIFDDQKRIFLVRLTYQRFHPWGLPGGGLEYGESAEDAARPTAGIAHNLAHPGARGPGKWREIAAN